MAMESSPPLVGETARLGFTHVKIREGSLGSDTSMGPGLHPTALKTCEGI